MRVNDPDRRKEGGRIPRRAFLEAVGAAASVNLPAFVAADEKARYPCPIKADLWVLGGQSNMCVLGYRNLQNCGELEKPVTLDRNGVRVFGLDNEWTDPIEPVHWFFNASAP